MCVREEERERERERERVCVCVCDEEKASKQVGPGIGRGITRKIDL